VHADASQTRMRDMVAVRLPSGTARRSQCLVQLRNRLLAITVIAGIAVLLLVFQYQFRHLEAAAAAWLHGAVTPTLAAPRARIVWFGLGNPGAFGLVITPDCSSALLIVLGTLAATPRILRWPFRPRRMRDNENLCIGRDGDPARTPGGSSNCSSRDYRGRSHPDVDGQLVCSE
jgi:hypothetical protein